MSYHNVLAAVKLDKTKIKCCDCHVDYWKNLPLVNLITRLRMSEVSVDFMMITR